MLEEVVLLGQIWQYLFKCRWFSLSGSLLFLGTGAKGFPQISLVRDRKGYEIRNFARDVRFW